MWSRLINYVSFCDLTMALLHICGSISKERNFLSVMQYKLSSSCSTTNCKLYFCSFCLHFLEQRTCQCGHIRTVTYINLIFIFFWHAYTTVQHPLHFLSPSVHPDTRKNFRATKRVFIKFHIGEFY